MSELFYPNVDFDMSLLLALYLLSWLSFSISFLDNSFWYVFAPANNKQVMVVVKHVDTKKNIKIVSIAEGTI